MNGRFVWLMRREWMQHRVGWLALVAVPLVVAALLVPFAEMSRAGQAPMPRGQSAAAMALFIYAVVCAVIIGASVLFQAAGTARRDQQDRSIEFWMSLPIGPVQGVGATVLMHLVVMPVVLIALSVVVGQGVALLSLARFGAAGFAADLAQLLTADWWAYTGLLLLRSVSGMLMAALWLSPVLLAMMAASVWLKRWGLPVVGLVGYFGSWLLERLAGVSVAIDTLGTWVRESAAALVPLSREPFKPEDAGGLATPMRWLWNGIVELFQAAASPQFVAGLAIAAGFFALLVWRRMR